MRVDDPVAETRGPGWLGWVSRLLVAGGAVTLAWCAVLVVDARMYQQSARQALASVPPRASVALLDAASSATTSRAVEAPPSDAALPGPGLSRPAYRSSSGLADGTPLGTLTIPRVKLSVVVLHGTDARTLRRGAGHIENTAFPGDTGNVAIAGHRDSFFLPLQYVRVGDDVLLETPRERLHYRVASLRIVAPTEVSVLAPTPDAVLTLTTCYPFGIFGSAPDRFVVRASRVVDPETATMSSAEVRSFEQKEQSDEGAGLPEHQEPALHDEAAELRVRSARPFSAGDEALVQQALARFRVAYNARLLRRGEVGSGALLPLQSCTVSIEGDRASATCGSALAPTAAADAGVWMFSLVRTGSAWDIRSVEAP